MTRSPAPTSRADAARVRGRRAGAVLAIAGVSTLVAALAHATAGGGWPNAATLLAAPVLSAFLTLPLVGARVRSWRIALVVAVDQLVFHALFATVGAATALPESGGHAQHALPVLLLGGETTAAGLGMGAHHALAGAVSFALLRGGWALVVAAIAAGAGLLLRPLRGVPALSEPPRAVAVRATPARLVLLDVLRHGVPRRGPPVAPALG